MKGLTFRTAWTFLFTVWSVSQKYVIVGHSERRQYFCETDATVNKKVHAVLNAGMNPIISVGESLEQRETGITNEWIALQVKSALYGVPADKLRRCIIAYEPI